MCPPEPPTEAYHLWISLLGLTQAAQYKRLEEALREAEQRGQRSMQERACEACTHAILEFKRVGQERLQEIPPDEKGYERCGERMCGAAGAQSRIEKLPLLDSVPRAEESP